MIVIQRSELRENRKQVHCDVFHYLNSPYNNIHNNKLDKINLTRRCFQLKINLPVSKETLLVSWVGRNYLNNTFVSGNETETADN